MSLITTDQFNATGIRLNPDACIVIVSTEWNAPIIQVLEEGVREVLDEAKVKYLSIQVPGAVEIGFAIKRYWESNKDKAASPVAFIALGCVIRGDTPHFDYVCQAVTDSVVHLNLSLPVPTVFGVLTVNSNEQAQERIGGKHGHKGREAAVTALKMIALTSSFE